ncbi:MAG TPA: hypothetical protein DIT93_12540 [Pelagibacterium sp.]|uniref:hypothetical protein n=1 Tax=uncultured Pelagibacterium sp. TaxID=1159875 RepID=UPI000C6B739D|nr:hypothetical protein [Pelagibacterium sp.]HCO55828.1 hypothetical protein [Pelagibacterium sp.]|tara:strand:+ start:395 stop:625 length:231 start_codon:yes stop_codon:yes gene_type:complete
MPVLAVFALAICSSTRFGVSSGPAIGFALFFWTLLALVSGTPIMAIGCVIAGANLGWLTGLWLQTQVHPRHAAGSF